MVAFVARMDRQRWRFCRFDFVQRRATLRARSRHSFVGSGALVIAGGVAARVVRLRQIHFAGIWSSVRPADGEEAPLAAGCCDSLSPDDVVACVVGLFAEEATPCGESSPPQADKRSVRQAAPHTAAMCRFATAPDLIMIGSIERMMGMRPPQAAPGRSSVDADEFDVFGTRTTTAA